MSTSTLPALVQRFFTDRLTAQLEASPNTIAGYRDTFRLLLRYASQRRNKAPTKLRIEDLDSALIGDFLTIWNKSAVIAPVAETSALPQSGRSIAMWR
jgi:integrase/recombinase XerD